MRWFFFFLGLIRSETAVWCLSLSGQPKSIKPRPLLTGVRWNELGRDLSSLKSGTKISDGIAATALFNGKNGPKMWIDVGAYNDVTLKNGTKVRRRVLGLLKLPIDISSKEDEDHRWRMVMQMLENAQEDPRQQRVRCYVEASRPASNRLVLRASPLRRRKQQTKHRYQHRLPLEKCKDFDTDLSVGTELSDAKIISVGKTLCRLSVPVRRGDRRVAAFLRAKDLPVGIILSTAPIKTPEAHILRTGDTIHSVFIKRLQPESLGIDLALAPLTFAEVQREEDDQKQNRQSRRARTGKLKAGDIVHGRITRVRNYGATVDFGATATGLILRKGTPLIEMKAWLHSEVQCTVVQVEREGRPKLAPRVTLERIFDEEQVDPTQVALRPDELALQVSGITPSTLADITLTSPKEDEVQEEYAADEDDDDDLGLDGLDDIDDIESSLGLDVY